MRIPTVRLIAAVTAALLPLAFLPAPAQAATITIVSRTGTTAGSPGIRVTTTNCEIPNLLSTPPSGYVDRTEWPGGAPLQTGSLRIYQGPPSQLQSPPNQQSGLTFLARPLSSLTTFRGAFRFDLPSTIQATLRVTQGNADWLAFANSTERAEHTWHQYDAAGLSYRWIEQGGLQREFDATIASFLNGYGDGSVVGLLAAARCGQFTGTTVYVDDFRVSDSNNIQVFDFEVPFAATMSIAATPQTITYGGSSTLSTTLKHGTTPLPGRQVTLYRVTSSDPVAVGSAKTDAYGVARKAVTPARNTTYFWYFFGDSNHSISWTAARPVYVRARISLTLADSTLRPGHPLVATGRVSPAKVGSVATLWRKTSSGRVKLRSITLTKADGTFRITKVLNTRGTYKVYVKVPAAKGNLAGTSPIRTATVS